jgi:predicted dehydrogenase
VTDMLRVAQIGCGYWGPNLLRNLSAQSGCHVKWVCDLSARRRAYVEANYPRTKTTANWDVVFEDPEIKAVVIATPAASHYQLVKAGLLSNKDVFVEKPLAMTTREADELIDLAAVKERMLMVGHTFLYNGAVRFVKDLLEKRELGRLYYIYSQRLNLGQVRSDVNAWWNLGPHDVSILLYWMAGELPVSVTAHGVDYIQPGIEDVVFATLTWASRVTAHVHVSWLDPGKARKMTLVGNRKMIVYDDISDDKIALLDRGIDRIPKTGEEMHYDDFSKFQLLHRTGDVWLPRINFDEPLKLETAHFLECVRTRQAPLTGPTHARDVVVVLEAVDRALKNGGSVAIPTRLK